MKTAFDPKKSLSGSSSGYYILCLGQARGSGAFFVVIPTTTTPLRRDQSKRVSRSAKRERRLRVLPAAFEKAGKTFVFSLVDVIAYRTGSL